MKIRRRRNPSAAQYFLRSALCFLALTFSACAGVQTGGSSLETARANALTAIQDMNGGKKTRAAHQAIPASAPKPAPAQDKRPARSGKPNWLYNPYTAFDKTTHLAAVGYGNERRQAEQNALANLSALFGQSIESSVTIIENYQQQRAKNGSSQHSAQFQAEQAVRTTAAFDTLIGAEIAGYWNDGKTDYAVAVMDKAEARRMYAVLMTENQKQIDHLLEAAAEDKGSLESYARHRQAAYLAGVNTALGKIASFLGASPQEAAVQRDKHYQTEAAKAARAVSVRLSVTGDKTDKIKAAFAEVLTTQGFSVGSGKQTAEKARYLLRADVVLEAMTLPNQHKWTRWSVNARLVDTQKGSELLPFNISGREGHLTQTEADERALREAADRIKTEYAAAIEAAASSGN